MHIKKVSIEDYEKVCFLLNKKPINNKILKGFFVDRLKKNQLLDTNFYFTEVDYLIISSNPMFACFVLKKLKERNINNVFIHNIFIEDAFNYKNLNLDNELSILEEIKKNDGYIFSTDKDSILSYSDRKHNDYFMFAGFHHPYKKIEKMFSEGYLGIWDKMQQKIKNKDLWSNKEFKKDNKHYESFVFAKKVIIQNPNNPYLNKNILDDKNCLFFNNQNINKIDALLKEF